MHVRKKLGYLINSHLHTLFGDEKLYLCTTVLYTVYECTKKYFPYIDDKRCHICGVNICINMCYAKVCYNLSKSVL